MRQARKRCSQLQAGSASVALPDGSDMTVPGRLSLHPSSRAAAQCHPSLVVVELPAAPCSSTA